MDGAGVVVVLGVFILIIVAVIAYGVGYLRAQDVSHRLEAEWRRLPMEAPVPRWRRAAGWAAYVSSALSLCLFLVVAYVYAYRWGWTYLTAAWIVWFGIFLGVLWLAEWCWKPSGEAQGGASEKEGSIRNDRRHPYPPSQPGRSEWLGRHGLLSWNLVIWKDQGTVHFASPCPPSEGLVALSWGILVARLTEKDLLGLPTAWRVAVV